MGVFSGVISPTGSIGSLSPSFCVSIIFVLPKTNCAFTEPARTQNENKINLIDNKTEYIKISKDKKEERNYKIKITYDKNKTNTINDIMEKIQVRVHTEQEKA